MLSKRKAELTLKETMRIKVILFFGLPLFLLITTLLAQFAQAKDLTGRLGVGYTNEWATHRQTNGVPALSLRYAMTRTISTELVGGIASNQPANTLLGLKFLRNIFLENNLNFNGFIGGGLSSANKKAGFEVLAGVGAEYFIPGIESLGFSMDLGATLNNASGSVGIQTMGVSFLNAGMHFYF